MTASGHPHAITIEHNPHRVTVSCQGLCLADTSRGLVLREGPLPPVHYIPREDVNMSHLKRTEHSTHCPFKGDASYFSLCMGDKTIENAVWSYENPLPSVAGIKNYMAFAAEHVQLTEEPSSLSQEKP